MEILVHFYNQWELGKYSQTYGRDHLYVNTDHTVAFHTSLTLYLLHKMK